MNFLSILRSIEDLIYEIALWVILGPKTFVTVFLQPSWSQSYLVAESEKPPTERYDRYMSPVLFWVFVSVLPYLYTVDFVVSHMSASPTTEGLRVLHYLASLPFEFRFLCVATFLLSGPLGFSTGTLVAQRRAVSRTHLQRVFYTQCYCFALAYLFLLPFVVIGIAAPEPVSEYLFTREPVAHTIYVVSSNLFFWWLLFAETRILRRELASGWLKAAGLFFVLLLGAFFLMLALEVLLFVSLAVSGRLY